MSKKKFKTFEELQSFWYGKLAKSGFKDLEAKNGTLKMYATLNPYITKLKTPYIEFTEEYHRIAGQFLHEHKFESRKDFRIWELHSEGVGAPAIAPILKKERFKSCSRSEVQRVTSALTSVMLQKYREELDN